MKGSQMVSKGFKQEKKINTIGIYFCRVPPKSDRSDRPSPFEDRLDPAYNFAFPNFHHTTIR